MRVPSNDHGAPPHRGVTLLLAACGGGDDPAGAPASSPVELARPPATSIASSSPTGFPACDDVPPANAADERVTTALAPVAGERICLTDTGVPAREGPQPDDGDGWRLLGDELVRCDVPHRDRHHRRAVPHAVERGRDDGANGRRSTSPAEVVVWFGAVYGSTCPIRLDDVAVVIDHEPALLHAVTVRARRDRIVHGRCQPARLRRGHRPRAAPGRAVRHPARRGRPAGRRTRGAHARRRRPDRPGATATADQVGPDPALIEASRQPQPVGVAASSSPGTRRRTGCTCTAGSPCSVSSTTSGG